MIDNNYDVRTPVDEFLDRYDTFSHFPDYIQGHFKNKDKELKRADLNQLGYSEKDFFALRFTDRGMAADTQLLTGGQYGKCLHSKETSRRCEEIHLQP